MFQTNLKVGKREPKNNITQRNGLHDPSNFKGGSKGRPIPSTPTTLHLANDRPLLPWLFSLFLSWSTRLFLLLHWRNSCPFLQHHHLTCTRDQSLFILKVLLYYLGNTKNQFKTFLPLFRDDPRTRRG